MARRLWRPRAGAGGRRRRRAERPGFDADACDVRRPHHGRDVLTPHAGEYAGWPARRSAPTASPAGAGTGGTPAHHPAEGLDDGGRRARRRGPVRATGDARLATAGTGDVLSGVVARSWPWGSSPPGPPPAAHVHGRAGPARTWRRGLVAGDLLDLLPCFSSLEACMTGETPVRDVMTTDVLTFRPDEQVDARRPAVLTERGVDGGSGHRRRRPRGGHATPPTTCWCRRRSCTTRRSSRSSVPTSSCRRRTRKFEQELRKAVAARVADAMSSNPVDAAGPTTLFSRRRPSCPHDVTRLPVTDVEGDLVGIVARGDILRANVK